MSFFTLKRLALFVSFFALSTIAFKSTANGQSRDWKPVSPQELQMTTPKIQAGADAEALLWDVYVSDESAGRSTPQTVLNHYLRIKIFNERGREAFSKIDIPFGRISNIGFDVKIQNIAARTTKPDGTVVELKGSEVFERDIVKGDGVKLKAKSFAVPGIEAGAVIEYRWKEVRGAVSYYQRLQFAREIPVHIVQYHIKPYPHPRLGMNGLPFNVTNTPFVKEKNDFYMTSVVNVPAFTEEPRMPPEYSVRPWLLLYYTAEAKRDEDKFWRDYGKEQYNAHKDQMKVTNEVKQATAEAVGNETDPDKKVEKIFNYVKTKIRNIYDDSLNLSEDDLKNVKENKNPGDTLKRGQGTGHDINMLFAAMITAAGMESRNVNLPRRSDIFFPKWFADEYFMRTENVGVKVGDTWKFYDPASRYIPFGMLAWYEEGQPALISDSKEPIWLKTPMSPASSSMEKRSGKFKLLPDGTLEGTATIEYTGHLSAYHKEYNDDDTPQQRETTLKNLVRYNILGSAEVSDVTIENVTDPFKPFTYIFKIKVPGYATVTGKRIFLQPNVFERNSKPLFERAERKHDIYFEYPYSEMDDLSIELPEGFQLESPDAPPDVTDAGGIGSNKIEIGISGDKRILKYKREFSFGNRDQLIFTSTTYPVLKRLFETYNSANTHPLTLRQSEAVSSK